ncbi:outer membrane beta-barrel protein [Opitutaceae bacterium]|nr:outer membrane beta-barrel protein [Opitutaceae bacterium]
MKPSAATVLRAITGVVGFLGASLPANALVRWNEAKDQVFVKGTVAWLYDSNIYTNAQGEADTIMQGSVGAEYRRQAGLIGVNADLGFTIAEFGENADDSFANPAMRVEFTKDTGRTTGTFAVNGNRSSRADPAANARIDSWNYGADLRIKYPVNDRHTFAGGLDWRFQDYQNNAQLVDLTTSSMSADWFYVFTEERDLFGGYRLRLSESSAGNKYADHSISGGVSGRIIRGLNGTARVGYQVREDLSGSGDTFTGFNASITSTWNFTRKVSLSVRASKDFNVTSTNIPTDATTGNLDLQYARTAKLVLGTGVGTGYTKFLGLDGGNREDTFLSYYGRIQYTFSEKLIISATYSYFQNWSTLLFSDFERDSITFDASTRF